MTSSSNLPYVFSESSVERKQLRSRAAFPNGVWDQGTEDHSAVLGRHSETHVTWSGVWGSVKNSSELPFQSRRMAFMGMGEACLMCPVKQVYESRKII